jgi:hypothetical protein
MPFGAAKKHIGKMPARRQCAKVEKFGGVPYPPEVTNLTPSLPLDRRGQGSQSTEFENCCVASMWYTGKSGDLIPIHHQEILWQDGPHPEAEATARADEPVKRARPGANATNGLVTERRHGYQNNLDTAKKPYYCVSKHPHISAGLATTALLGLAPARSTRASAANHRESISACWRDDLGVANENVTSKVTDHACPQHSRARVGRLRRAEITA